MTTLRRTTAALTAIMLAAAGLALAQQAEKKPETKPASAASAGPPKPAPETEQLKYFAGTWECAGKASASELGPEHATKGKATIKPDLGNFWYSVRYEEQPSRENPSPLKLHAFWGYNAAPKGKGFLAYGFDSTGNFLIQSSPGWEGDKLVWGGALTGRQGMAARDTFTRKSDNELLHLGEVRRAQGPWQELDEETCKKVAR